MNAIRQTVEVINHTINIELPKDFNAELVDVIILPKEEEHPSELSDSFYEEMEERRRKFQSGETKSYSWEDVKNRITNARNAI